MSGTGRTLGGTNSHDPAARANRLDDNAQANAEANLEEGRPAGGADAFRQSSPSAATNTQPNTGRGHEFPATIDNAGSVTPRSGTTDNMSGTGRTLGGTNSHDPAARANRLDDNAQANAEANLEEGRPAGGADAFRQSSPSAATNTQPNTGRGHQFPATIDNAGSVTPRSGTTDNMSGTGRTLGGTNSHDPAARANRLDDNAQANAEANLEEGRPAGGADAFRQSSPSAATNTQPNTGRGHQFPATIDNAGSVTPRSGTTDNMSGTGRTLGGTNSHDPAARANRLDDNAQANAEVNLEEGRPAGGADAFRQSSPSAATNTQPNTGRGHQFPATIDNAGSVTPRSGTTDNMSGTGRTLGGTNSHDPAARANRLDDNAQANAEANLEEGRPAGGADAFRQSSPSAATNTQPNTGRGHQFPATIDNAGSVTPRSGTTDNFSGTGRTLGGTNSHDPAARVRDIRAGKLQDNADDNALADMEEGHAGQGLSRLVHQEAFDVGSSDGDGRCTNPCRPAECGNGRGGTRGPGDPAGSPGPGGLGQRSASNGSSTVTIDPNASVGRAGGMAAPPGKTSETSNPTETESSPTASGSEGPHGLGSHA
ncbi:hypothetical protein NKH18_15060 [Streptomyces sp. M10(2022)]